VAATATLVTLALYADRHGAGSPVAGAPPNPPPTVAAKRGGVAFDRSAQLATSSSSGNGGGSSDTLRGGAELRARAAVHASTVSTPEVKQLRADWPMASVNLPLVEADLQIIRTGTWVA